MRLCSDNVTNNAATNWVLPQTHDPTGLKGADNDNNDFFKLINTALMFEICKCYLRLVWSGGQKRPWMALVQNSIFSNSKLVWTDFKRINEVCMLSYILL